LKNEKVDVFGTQCTNKDHAISGASRPVAEEWPAAGRSLLYTHPWLCTSILLSNLIKKIQGKILVWFLSSLDAPLHNYTGT